MGKSHGKFGQVGGDDRTVVREKVNCFLRQVHPVKTAEGVSADTGIAANTIEKWLMRGSAPASWAYLRLLSVYGPELACATMDNPPGWLVKAARDEKNRRVKAEIARLQSELEENAA